MASLQQVRGTGVRYTLPYVLRFSGIWLAVSGLILLVFALSSYLVAFNRLEEPYRGRIALVLMVQTALVLAALVALAVFTTHRLAGPLIGLRRAMEDVKAGDMSRTLRFRRTDPHLGEIENAFNEMMEALRQRSGEGGAPPEGLKGS